MERKETLFYLFEFLHLIFFNEVQNKKVFKKKNRKVNENDCRLIWDASFNFFKNQIFQFLEC